MAKSTKHQDALGSFDNFRAPWQTETGEDAEIVPATLARLIYNLRLDKAKLADANEDAKAAVTAAEAERDEAVTNAANANGPEAQKQIDKLTKERDDAVAERDSLKNEKAQAELRAEVLGDFEAKYPKAAKYIKGETEEELKESLEAVKEDFGITDEGSEEVDTDEEPAVKTTPRTKSLLNPGDKENGKPGNQGYDYDKIAADIQGASIFG